MRRLAEWAHNVTYGRYERPQYQNPGELKADVIRLLEYAVALEFELRKYVHQPDSEFNPRQVMTPYDDSPRLATFIEAHVLGIDKSD